MALIDEDTHIANRSIKKRYVAVLDGAIIKTEKETKPIAEKAILIAKETVLTKKNSKSRKNRKYRKNRTPSLSESSRPSSANG
jgi:tRNA pseudouridine32 synthase / 23S rRNA pseudouridine746 synthase